MVDDLIESGEQHPGAVEHLGLGAHIVLPSVAEDVEAVAPVAAGVLLPGSEARGVVLVGADDVLGRLSASREKAFAQVPVASVSSVVKGGP